MSNKKNIYQKYKNPIEAIETVWHEVEYEVYKGADFPDIYAEVRNRLPEIKDQVSNEVINKIVSMYNLAEELYHSTGWHENSIKHKE